MYRVISCNTRSIAVGVCLWVVRMAFGDRPPTLVDYAAEHGISADTIRRAGRALFRPVLACLRARRPGPRAIPSSKLETQSEACLACNDLLRGLLPAPLSELANTPQKRGLVAQTARHWASRGVRLKTLSCWLAISTKTLRRWIDRLDDQEVQHKSRRPETSPKQLPAEIQRAITDLRQAMPDISIADLTRVLVRKFADMLRRHGRTSLSTKTVGRYAAAPHRPQITSSAPSSQRGAYRYPPPLAMAWIDTTYFEVAGTTVHIVAAMEASSRVVLAGDVFVQESAATTVEVLGRALVRVPELSAVLRDRGKPYLNATVNEMLGAQGVLPIDAHPYFPIDKAGLERFWRWLKEWLRYALGAFEERCLCDGRAPDADEIAALVQPALRVCLRAYNLLPQPYLEKSSPIERIDRLLRAEDNPGFALSDMQRLAVDRETKDDLLQQVRDGLQLDRKSIAQMRADLAAISRPALRSAIDAVAHRLFVERDETIRRPYGYLIAVAKHKERGHQRSQAHARRTVADQHQRQENRDRTDAALRQDKQQREQHPEDVLPGTIQAWVKAMAGRIRACRTTCTRELAVVLSSLRRKVGTAFDAQVDAAREAVSSLVTRTRPNDTGFADRVDQAFCRIVDDAIGAGGGRYAPPVVCSPINQARGSPPGSSDAHVSGTDVSP